MDFIVSLSNRSPSGLTWHDTIPSNEVWVKLGGDKDHGSFKMNMQVDGDKAIPNTCLIAAFKAGDSTANLHIALDQYSFKHNLQVVNVTQTIPLITPASLRHSRQDIALPTST